MPTFDQVHEPARVLLGDQEFKVLDLGVRKVWPLHGPGGAPVVCNPTVAGIAVKNLDATVMEPATAPVTVNWGDGVSEVVTPVGGMLKACHIYAKPGVRTIALSDGVVKSQKVNAGVVPTTTQQVVHPFEALGGGVYPKAVYQGDPSAAASTAPASWGEKTPFCDGVLRMHLWIGGEPTTPMQVQMAMDVSFGGEWWNISGNMLGDISGSGETYKFTSNPDDYKIYSQAYLPGVHTQSDVIAAWPSGVFWPGTTSELLASSNTDLMASWIFTDDGKLIVTSLSSGLTITSIGLLTDDASTGIFGTFAMPPGFDGSMAPALWVF
jgi:hypothetical protein